MSSEREPLDIEKALNLLKGSEKNFAFTCEQDIRLATPDYAKFSAAFTAFSIARLALDELKAARQDWQPIETLPLREGHGIRVSESVLLSRTYSGSAPHIMLGRVWLEKGEYTLPDNKYEYYEHITHWMPLPPAPKGGDNS